MQFDYTQDNWHDWAYRAALIGALMLFMVWLYKDIERRQNDPCSTTLGATPSEYYQLCVDKVRGKR